MKNPIRQIVPTVAGLILAATAWVASAQADSKFEPAPALAGAQLAPATLLKGANFDVAEPVRIDRFLGSFKLHSAYGTFDVSGVDMLAGRVRELRAIEELQKVESSSTFTEALAKSASGTVKLVGSLVTEPGKTVENIAAGAGTVLGRIGYSVKSGAQNAGDAMTKSSSTQQEQKPTTAGGAEPPSFTDDPFGYNQARRQWAKKLEIDPYTTNPVLRPLLDKAASATFAGNFAVGLTVGAVAAPLGYASDFETTVRDSVWDQPPGDLAKGNEEKLQRMGVPADVVRAFLRNRWYTPTQQTALVAALDKLNGVSGRDAVVRTATTIAGEVPARLLVRSLGLLGDYHQRETPLVQVRMRGIVPVAKSKNGSLVAAAAIDYLYWSEESAAFARAQELAADKRVMLIAGGTSDRATAEFSRIGWKVRGGLRPVRGS
jgi:hypothetical protein